MKKTKFLAIPVFAALVLTGCASNQATANKAPSVVGVKDIQCMVNSTVDFLDGVAALDIEDGDITPELKITITPQVEVVNGYAHFTEVGEYTVNYAVSDSAGRTAQKRAYVDVVDRETYKTFNMPEGFAVETDGRATLEKSGMENGKFKIEAKGGEISEDIRLTRTFNLTTDLPYTFHYTVNSDVAGKILVLADGDACAEIAVKEGVNVLTFTHTARKADDEDVRDVKIDICLGSLGNMKWTVDGVEYEYPQEEGKLVELAENFNFAGRVVPRIDNDGGKNGLEGNAWSENGGAAARLEITSPSENAGDIWRGGMFINTEINLRANVTYTVSFDIESKEDKNFEVIIQRGQWDEHKFITVFNPDGKVEQVITPDENSSGALWIYVQSGTEVNQITLSNLSVKERLGAVGKDTFAIQDFTEFHNSNFNSTLTTGKGGFSYLIENFSAVDNEHTVTSPSFFIAGSGGNYVITFTAKATAPVEMIVAAPVYGGWDPTLMWSRVNVTEEEQVFTFFCNGNASDRLYTIVWQFGSASNQKYNNVNIEISNIKVSLKNRELDG